MSETFGSKCGEIRHRRVAGNPRRIQMRLVMMNAEERFAQSKRHGLRGFEADHQRIRQTRPVRGGDGIKLLRA